MGTREKSKCFLTFTIAALLSFVVSDTAFADKITEFKELSENNPIKDEDCVKHDGDPLRVGDTEMERVMRYGKNNDRLIYFDNHIYVTYGILSESLFSKFIAPSYSLNLCKF